MSKTTNLSVLKDLNLQDDWSTHPAAEWIIRHKKTLLWILIGLIALLIAAARFATTKTLNAEADFFHAQTAFSQFQKEIAASQTTDALINLEQLDAIMERRPEIKPKYEGPLAQTLLVSGYAAQAEPFAHDIFDRTRHEHLSLYQNFSKTSFLIETGEINSALSEAQKLQDQLESPEAQEHPLLNSFNLIRLAFLYQLTDQPRQEMLAWEHLRNQSIQSEAMNEINRTLKIGKTTLNQYIDEREKVLKP